jgi:hypothetical protein
MHPKRSAENSAIMKEAEGRNKDSFKSTRHNDGLRLLVLNNPFQS